MFEWEFLNNRSGWPEKQNEEYNPVTGNMNEFGNIMMIKFKLFQFEKMFNIFQITGDQIIHANNMITFFDKTVAKMRAQETGSTCY